MSIHSNTCPNCGGALPPNAPSGHCPACLFRVGLAVADGGLANGLEEAAKRESPTAERDSGSAPPRIRYVGDYELLEEIGRGGMGVVYKARQASLNRLVALKLVRAGEFADEKEVARFRAEAEAAAHLDHPNVVPIYEVGEHEGRHYFSMKLVEGGALSARISNRKSQISNRDAAKLLVTIARAVHYAHQRGLLHRDLKPGNILLDAQGHPFVTDFGLAKRIETDSAMTQSGAIVGTPAYIAPEQASGAKGLSTAADVYSLGAILYELLTNRPPFVGATVMETLQKVMNEEPVRPSKCEGRSERGDPKRAFAPRPSPLSPDLETICLKCLEKDPTRRYGSAEALAEDLEGCLRGEPIRARPIGALERFQLWCRRKPAIAGLSAGAIFVLILGAAGVLWQWRKAVTARGEAQESALLAKRELQKSQMAHLRLIVGTRRPGHRLESLRLLQTLSSNGPTAELRNLALPALSSSDIRQLGNWRTLPFEPSCSPAFDGSLARVALGDHSGSIKLCSFPDLHEITSLPSRGSTAGSIIWVNHDRWLAVALADGRVMLWDTVSARVLFETNGCSGPGRGQRLAIHPAGNFLAMSGVNKQLRVFELETQRELPSLIFPWPVQSLAFNSVGDKLAVSFLDHLKVLEFPSLQTLTDDPAPDYFANQMVWEPGDRWLLAAMQGWNVLRIHPGMAKDGQIRGTAHDSAALTLSRNSTGSLLVSFGADKTSYLWEACFPYNVLTLSGWAALRFAAEGNRFAGWHHLQGLAIFEAIPSSEVRHLVGQPPHTMQLLSCSAHPSLPLVAVASRQHAAVFDLEAAEERLDVELQNCAGAFLSLDANQLMTVSRAGVQSWPILRTNDSARSRWGLGRPTLVAALGTNFPPQAAGGTLTNGRFVAAGSARTVVVDLRERRVLRDLRPSDRSGFPAVAHDGSWRVTSQTAPESTWLAVGDAKPRRLSTAGGRVAMNSEGSRLAVAGLSRIECFDTSDWRLLWSLPIEMTTETSGPCSFSANGQWLGVSLNGHDAVLLNVASGEILGRFRVPGSPLVFGVNFGQNDTELFVTTMYGLFVWDLTLVRRELARIHLDWPDRNPSDGFAPRQ